MPNAYANAAELRNANTSTSTATIRVQLTNGTYTCPMVWAEVWLIRSRGR